MSFWIQFSVLFLLSLSISSLSLSSSDDEPICYAPIVEVNDGKILGIVQEAENGAKVYSYIGIRYGISKRFRAAKRAPSWHPAVYDATHWRDACPQPGLIGRYKNITVQTDRMSEDCHFLTVWSSLPKNESSTQHTLKSVMFWLHGGGFTIGNIFSVYYDGRYLASQGDVVVVAANYRLGPFGFLYGGDDGQHYDTNLGIRDQILALEWIRENIEAFGGDPNSVTVFGNSAGSISAGALLLSPLARPGLFHRVIMESGAPNSLFGQLSKRTALARTRAFAARVGCADNDSSLMMKCLQVQPMEVLANATNLDYANEHEFFVPIYGDTVIPVEPIKVINGEINNNNNLNQTINGSLINVNVDLMFGVVANEGTWFAHSIIPEFRPTSPTNFTLNEAKNILEKFIRLLDPPQLPVEEIAKFYIGQLSPNASQDEIKQKVSEAWGDFQLLCPTILFAESFFHHQGSSELPNSKRSIYSYRIAQHAHIVLFGPEPSWLGAIHGEDTTYLFMLPFIRDNEPATELANAMISAWSNFAKTGSPGPIGGVEWTQAFNDDDHQKQQSSYTPKYMKLHVQQYQMVEHKYVHNCDQFWRSRLRKYLLNL